MRVTILDVAREAGVSKSTVSLVINNADTVKLSTRYKVMQTIEKLGYVPNLAARELTTQKTHTFGLIFLTANWRQKPYAFSSVSETLLYDTSNGIYEGLQDTSYSLLIERFSMDREPHELPKLVKSRRLDGVFLVGGLFTEDFIRDLDAYHLPVVLIGRQYKDIDCVSVDVYEAGRMGIDYLLKSGYQRLAFVNGPQSSVNSQKKLAGANVAFASAGSECELQTVYADGYSGLDGYQAFGKLWESGYKPEAVFGGSDGITAGIMRYAYEKKLRIPKDLAVLGYEDSLISEYASPAISVIDGHKEQMGKEALQMMLNRVRRPRAKTMRLEIAPSLIIRESTQR